MAETILIELSEIPKRTPLGGNIDTDKYRYCLEDVQKEILEPALGTKLYEKMKTDYPTFAGDYVTLHTNYITPILINATAAEYMVSNAIVFDNNGAYKNAPDGAESVSIAEIESVAQNRRAKVDMDLDRMARFLSSKSDTIPEYAANQDNDYDISKDSDINTGISWHL